MNCFIKRMFIFSFESVLQNDKTIKILLFYLKNAFKIFAHFLKICFCSNVFGLLAGIPATCHFLLGTVKKIFFTVPFFCLLKIVIHGHMEAIPLSYVVLSLQRAAGRDWASTGNCLVTVSPSSLLLADT